MENRKERPSIKEELRRAKEDAGALKQKAEEAWMTNPYVKTITYVTGAIILVWASQYVFAAFEGAIRQFKKLRKTIKE